MHPLLLPRQAGRQLRGAASATGGWRGREGVLGCGGGQLQAQRRGGQGGGGAFGGWAGGRAQGPGVA